MTLNEAFFALDESPGRGEAGREGEALTVIYAMVSTGPGLTPSHQCCMLGSAPTPCTLRLQWRGREDGGCSWGGGAAVGWADREKRERSTSEGAASVDDASLSPWPSAPSPAPLFHLDQSWALSLLIIIYEGQFFSEVAPKLSLHLFHTAVWFLIP